MKKIAWLTIAVSVGLAGTLIGATKEERRDAQEDAEVRHPKFRAANIQIVDEGGKPVRDVKVRLFGIERFDRMPDGVEHKPFSADCVWDFITDEDGRFTAWFGKFDARRYWDKTGIHFPGWSEFYFIAEKEGYAGGVSRRILNWGEDLSYLGFYHNEWFSKTRPAIRLKDGDNKTIQVVLRRGIRVAGQIRDTSGKPIAGHRVGISHELHVDTHTGAGGEFFCRSTETDATGRFSFEHVYPNKFSFGCGGHWARTRVGKKWFDVPVDRITPPRGAEEIHLEAVLADNPPFHHTGCVTDTKGRPVSDVQVVLGLSEHWPAETWCDTHHYEYVTTGSDGKFEHWDDRPFLGFIDIKSPGYKAVNSAYRDEDGKPPLRGYRLIVKKADQPR